MRTRPTIDRASRLHSLSRLFCSPHRIWPTPETSNRHRRLHALERLQNADESPGFRPALLPEDEVRSVTAAGNSARALHELFETWKARLRMEDDR
jgi:hypothetical protein